MNRGKEQITMSGTYRKPLKRNQDARNLYKIRINLDEPAATGPHTTVGYRN